MTNTLQRVSDYFSIALRERHFPLDIPAVTRIDLAKLFGSLGFTVGVELGVERAAYSEVLCRENQGVHLHCVDSWAAYSGYKDHVRSDKLELFYQEAQTKLAPYPNVRFVRKFSVDAAADYRNGSLDFVYIDANHSLPHVIADLAAWTPKVKAGGIISGHDYARHRWPDQIHVVQGVQAWTDSYDIKPWFVLGAQAKDGLPRDDARSFFWVHEPRPLLRKGMARPIHQ